MINVLILRSVSGAGKSYFTDILLNNPKNLQVSADDYFMDEKGNYNFKVEELGKAHQQCKDNFMKYLKEPWVENIIVNNTNTKISDFSFYEKNAKEYGANVIFLVIENRHGNVDVHGVPEEALNRQETNIKQSLKLR